MPPLLGIPRPGPAKGFAPNGFELAYAALSLYSWLSIFTSCVFNSLFPLVFYYIISY